MDLAFDAVLFDRDGTLIRDVPYNGDPSRVVRELVIAHSEEPSWP
jgi:hypothetical protein